MTPFISMTLGCLFVFLAGFNVWNRLSPRGMSAQGSRVWTQVHRIAGYAFIALFAIFGYFMLLRIKGWSDELAPRLIVHMGLGLVLAPLLVAKVMVARYQKSARDLLMSLGIAIFAIAFTLVALNLSVHFLRAVSGNKVPAGISAAVVFVMLTSAAYLAGGQRRKTGSKAANLAGSKPESQERQIQSKVLHLTLARIQPQTQDAKTLRLLLPPGQAIGARPGQFLTFEWIIDGKPVTRSYSICSSPAQTGFVEITVKRVANGHVSQFLNERATVGLTVRAQGPYGQFCLDESQHRRVVLIAAGSGITPMMAMLRYLDDRCIAVDTRLLYCVRSEQDVFFRSELAGLRDRLGKFRYRLVVSQPSPGWTGWRGRFRREIVEREVENPRESTFFLCGPPAFMEAARGVLKDMGVEPSRILQESFGGAVAGEPSAPAPSGALEVRFSRSAVAYKVPPEQTLLESSEKNGVLIPSGCRQGVCGTCATKLLSGKVQMEKEDALNDELRRQGYILPCVSRPIGDITLDA